MILTYIYSIQDVYFGDMTGQLYNLIFIDIYAF